MVSFNIFDYYSIIWAYWIASFIIPVLLMGKSNQMANDDNFSWESVHNLTSIKDWHDCHKWFNVCCMDNSSINHFHWCLKFRRRSFEIKCKLVRKGLSISTPFAFVTPVSRLYLHLTLFPPDPLDFLKISSKRLSLRPWNSVTFSPYLIDAF